jgi:peptidoglycan/LPS O-acetylase OafA/YrhL
VTRAPQREEEGAEPAGTVPSGGFGLQRPVGATKRLGYQPALDGLRALAVVLVMMHHDNAGRATDHGLVQGGYIGVDIFFVLSGFLITSILLSDHSKTGKTVSGRFWLRRARRLLPPFVVLMVLISIYAVVASPNTGMSDIRGQAIATLLYFENWWVIAGHGGLVPLSQTWSLSIEEQWYLVWPFMLAGLLWVARGSRRALLACVLGCACLSAMVMAFSYSAANYSRVYNGTDTRAWQLLAGAALAVALAGRPQLQGKAARAWVEVVGIVGLVAIFVSAANMDAADAWLYPYGLLVVTLGAVAVIAASIQDGSPVLRRVLGWKPFVALGVISYGVYLYHLVVYSVLTESRTDIGGFELTLVRFAVTFAIATASYWLVEKPIRHGVPWTPVKLGGAAVTVAAAVAVVISATVTPPRPKLSQVAKPLSKLRATAPAGSTRVLIAGDGLAFGMSYRIKNPIDIDGVRGASASMIGCGIASGAVLINKVVSPRQPCPFLWSELYRDAVSAFQPQVTMLMVGQGEIFDRKIDKRVLRVGTPEMAQYLTAQLERARKVLTARGAPMFLATVPCVDPPSSTQPNLAKVERDSRRTAWVNGVWHAFAAEHPSDVRIFDLASLACPGGNARMPVGGVDLRPDGANLSAEGVRYVWKQLAAPAIASVRPTAEAAGR